MSATTSFVLAFFLTEAQAQVGKERGDFLRLSKEFKQARRPLRAKLRNLLVAAGLAGQSRQGAAGEAAVPAGGAAILWRPKRKRFEKYDGDLTNAEEVLSFVRSAIDGGRMLAQRHDEL